MLGFDWFVVWARFWWFLILWVLGIAVFEGLWVCREFWLTCVILCLDLCLFGIEVAFVVFECRVCVFLRFCVWMGVLFCCF